MRKFLILALMFVFVVGGYSATSKYRIDINESEARVQLRGIAGTRTEGEVIEGVYDDVLFNAYEFDVEITGEYEVYVLVGASWVLWSDWGGDEGKTVTAPDLTIHLQGHGTGEDGKISWADIDDAAKVYMEASNPDDVTIEWDDRGTALQLKEGGIDTVHLSAETKAYIGSTGGISSLAELNELDPDISDLDIIAIQHPDSSLPSQVTVGDLSDKILVSAGAGDITAVVAGDGLEGGSTAGSATLALYILELDSSATILPTASIPYQRTGSEALGRITPENLVNPVALNDTSTTWYASTGHSHNIDLTADAISDGTSKKMMSAHQEEVLETVDDGTVGNIPISDGMNGLTYSDKLSWDEEENQLLINVESSQAHFAVGTSMSVLDSNGYVIFKADDDSSFGNGNYTFPKTAPDSAGMVPISDSDSTTVWGVAGSSSSYTLPDTIAIDSLNTRALTVTGEIRGVDITASGTVGADSIYSKDVTVNNRLYIKKDGYFEAYDAGGGVYYPKANNAATSTPRLYLGTSFLASAPTYLQINAFGKYVALSTSGSNINAGNNGVKIAASNTEATAGDSLLQVAGGASFDTGIKTGTIELSAGVIDTTETDTSHATKPWVRSYVEQNAAAPSEATSAHWDVGYRIDNPGSSSFTYELIYYNSSPTDTIEIAIVSAVGAPTSTSTVKFYQSNMKNTSTASYTSIADIVLQRTDTDQAFSKREAALSPTVDIPPYYGIFLETTSISSDDYIFVWLSGEVK